MRVIVNIKTGKLPIIYRHRIVALIKEALKISDEEYCNFLYGNKIPKPFSFNLSLPPQREVTEAVVQIDERHTIEDKVFTFPENSLCRLFISSPDYRFLIALYNGIRKMGEFEFSSENHMLVNGERLRWKIHGITVLNEKPIVRNRAIFRTCSPIVLEDKDDRPVVFDEGRFSHELNLVMDKILKSATGRGLREELKFKPVRMKKQVVKHTLKEFRGRTGKPVMYITANAGTFELRGHPEDLTLIYQIGLGNRTGQGFGMVEVVG